MKKDKHVGDRVVISNEKDHLFVLISGHVESWKEVLLLTWLVGWTFCGIVVLTQFFGDYPRDTKLAFFIYMCFWFYFEFKIGYAWMWRKFGQEMIKVDQDGIKAKRDIRSYGKVRTFFRENIKSIQPLKIGTTSYAGVFNRSFWVVGGETIKLDYLGQDVAIGMQLNDNEKNEVIRILKKALRDYAPSEDSK